MLTFMVPQNRSPSTRAIERHLASASHAARLGLTIIQSIKQLKRSYSRHLKRLHQRFTRLDTSLDMLTTQFHSLSKPVDPNM